MEGSPAALLAHARTLLVMARDEAVDGFKDGDAVKVRRAAHRAWKAAVAATDAAMSARGIPRDGTAADRAAHYAFLDSLDEGDLSRHYALFSDRLRGLYAEVGHLPSEALWERHLADVAAFVITMAAVIDDGAPARADDKGAP